MLLAVAGLDDAELKERTRRLADGNWADFTPAERLGFGFAYKLSREPAEVTDADVAAVVAAFGPDRAIDLIWYVGWVNYMTRIADAFQLPLERENVFARPPAEAKPLGPEEARKQVGRSITVRMTVATSKDRLERRGEIYLDAEEDFRDPKNFAVVVTRKGAASLKAAGIDDPAGHFHGKTIRAAGTVREVDGVPRIEVDDAEQITAE
jgi:hypothetical protein